MSEILSPAEKEFQERKAKELAEHPDKKDAIEVASTMTELYLAVKEDQDEDESQDENGEKTPKSLGIVEHVHRVVKEQKEPENDNDGSVDLSKTGGSVPLISSQPKQKTWQSTEQMLDDLFKLEMRGKIEKTKKKPNQELIDAGAEATKQIEKLWDTALTDKGGRHYVKRAREDLLRGRFTFEEPTWLRDLMNPEGRKNAKRKPFIEEE